jgi:hypothetical protein
VSTQTVVSPLSSSFGRFLQILSEGPRDGKRVGENHLQDPMKIQLGKRDRMFGSLFVFVMTVILGIFSQL